MLQKAPWLVAAILVVAVAYWLLRDELSFDSPPTREVPAAESASPRVPEPSGTTPSPLAEPGATDELPPPGETPSPVSTPLPPLAESDPFVRERLAAFDLPEDWTAREDLVPRLALLAENATRGDLAHKRLRFLVPEEPFRVVERDGKLFADPRNARRFDPYLDLLERIPPAEAAAFLTTIEPLLDAALDQLGSPATARQTLGQAIAWVLEVRAPATEPELVRPKVLYEFADPGLEGLPPLDKQLLRIGPGNLERLKRYLAAVERALR